VTQAEFTDVLKKLWFVDHVPGMDEATWVRFRDDPAGTFRKMPEPMAGRVWEKIKP
jgi:hypothetical protein